MLLADFVCRGDGALLKVRLALALDNAKLHPIPRGDERNRNPALPGASRSPAPVRIHGGIVREVIVDHVRNVFHVQTASRNIGRNQDPHCLLAELAHDGIALRLREIPVEGFGVDAIVHQRFAQLLGVNPRPAKD